MNKIFIFLSKYLLFILNKSYLINLLSDKLYVQLVFFRVMGKKIDLKKPATFNEKINWLKLNKINYNYSLLVDKYEVKRIVEGIIGKEYIIKTYGIYNSFEEINFLQLPNSFVIKCTHDSGHIIVCKDKNNLDINKSSKIIKNRLQQNLYYKGREYPYKNIIPRIIIEELLIDDNKYVLDYKFFCFHGKVKFCKVDFGRFIEHHANYYSTSWEFIDFGERICPPIKEHYIPKPLNLEQMIQICEKLSKDFPFVRIDLYNIKNTIKFGEITFFPASGFGKFIPENADFIIGEMLLIEN